MINPDNDPLARARENEAISKMNPKLQEKLLWFLNLYEFDGMDSVGEVPPEFVPAVNEYYRNYFRLWVHGEGENMPEFDISTMRINH
jgi:hypothetical protein